MRPEEFRAICLARYGYGWQTRLAAEISVNARTVRRWASGEAEIPAAVAHAIQARPCIAIDYPDEWLLAAAEDEVTGDEREYIIRLHSPRFIGLIESDAVAPGGMTIALTDETVCAITWIDPEPADLAAMVRSLQEFMDSQST